MVRSTGIQQSIRICVNHNLWIRWDSDKMYNHTHTYIRMYT